MRYKICHIALTAVLLTVISASAQNRDTGKYFIKVTAEKGIGNTVNMKSSLPDVSTTSESEDLGIDFGMEVWKKGRHSLEFNVGLGYGTTRMTADLPKLDYSYSAPAAADMDNEPYIRFYELSGLHQKIRSDRIILPVYLTYRYSPSKIFSLHAMAGIKPSCKVFTKIEETRGEAFIYGVYPQYADLMIDAPYMNNFGERELSLDQVQKPRPYATVFSAFVGLGAKIRVWGPLAVDVSVRYEGATSNIFNCAFKKVKSFDARNAPVKYTVADGETVVPFSAYFWRSKFSQFTYGLSLIYHL